MLQIRPMPVAAARRRAVRNPNAAHDVDATPLRRMMRGYIDTQLLHLMAQLDLADHLAAGPQSADELAAATGIAATTLRRVLPALAARGLLARDGAGRFALTPTGALLRRDDPTGLREMALWHGHEAYRAWAELFAGLQDGDTAFQRAHGLDFFGFLSGSHEAQGRFNHVVGAVARRIAGDLLARYDFSGVRAIVDLGGGDGTLIAAIADALPHVSATVVERAGQLGNAMRTFARLPEGHRCRAVEGDFLVAAPVGGDLYLLSQILHDWDDDTALRILRNCRAALASGGRVLVIEQLLPEHGPARRSVLDSDLYMLAVTGGRERTCTEFRELADAAGLRPCRVLALNPAWSALECRRA